jgi:hypothetical protein
MEYAHAHVHGDESSTKMKKKKKNIIVASSLFDNKNRSPTAEYTGILYVYEPLNRF